MNKDINNSKKISLFNEELEQAVIRYLVDNPEQFFDKAQQLKNPNFCSSALNQEVLNYCVDKIIKRESVSRYDLFNYFRQQEANLFWLRESEIQIKNPKDFLYSVDILFDLSFRRSIFDLVDKTKESLRVAEKTPQGVASELFGDIMKFERGDVYSDIEKISEKSKEELEIIKSGKNFQTGFPVIDSSVYGMIGSHIWIVGGYTNTGKTYVASNILLNLLKQNAKVGFFSLEMSSSEVLRRILGIHLGCGVDGYIRDTLTDRQKEMEKEFLHKYKNQLEIIDYCRTVSDIGAECKRMMVKGGLDVVFIDFIQNIRTRSNEIYEAMREASLLLQQLAKDLKITVVALSQLSNEYAKKGGVLQYKGAGEVAQVADVGVMLFDSTEDYLAVSGGDLKHKGGVFKPIVFDVVKSRHSSLIKSAMMLDFPSGRLVELPPSDRRNWLSENQNQPKMSTAKQVKIEEVNDEL